MEIPFSYADENFIVVPVKINDSIDAKFVLDTGIGVNLISKSLCDRLKCEIKSHHTGRRMSGQEITIPISSVKALSFGAVRKAEVSVGVFDMEQLMPGAGVDGFLSLGFFKDVGFTVDYKRNVVTLESPSALAALRLAGSAVPIRVDVDGPGTSIHMPLVLPGGKQIMAEVDTGSQALILDEKFMSELRIGPKDQNVKSRQGKDETGHVFNRYFTQLKGDVHIPGRKDMKVSSISVMFQKIIYEGLVGQFFLREFLVTYNLKNSEMIFRKSGDTN